ncbi:MAG: hypothetical protein CL681_01575 [Blastopirellula sp.]|nr:hypothetical protein [Blastopirellula sp.]MAR08648.1 hypothetical protein [Blastopirellula sp.]|tara:strand:+ start:1960 stop:2187 length:228 start_codon:yes stop_codon:yes gene_type:complete
MGYDFFYLIASFAISLATFLIQIRHHLGGQHFRPPDYCIVYHASMVLCRSVLLDLAANDQQTSTKKEKTLFNQCI